MPNRPAHFEIHTDDPERAIAFYVSVFGWEIKKWEDGQFEYWMVMTGKNEEPGINGGLIRRPNAAPASGQGMNGYCITMIVDDYDATAAKVLSAGGKETVPKFPLIGMAWQGYFIDTEGNTFGLHQADVNAK